MIGGTLVNKEGRITKSRKDRGYNAAEYKKAIIDIKNKILRARQTAVSAANKELILLYWEIGKIILQKQKKEGWGAKVIDKMSRDLTLEFEDMRGFSVRNLKYMRKFAEENRDRAIVQAVLAQLPWYHNMALMDKTSDLNERVWYAKKTIENGWSRNVLVHQVESGLFARQVAGPKTHNFARTMTKAQSDLADETMKDPYVFDFLNISERASEKELEKNLINHIASFLLELGRGFAYVGRQYHINAGGEDFYIDLLFYHLELRCYVAIELKTGAFKPEYAGKMNFYLSVIDSKMNKQGDNPSIGMILCREKNRVVAEYSLRNITKPMGVSAYKTAARIKEKLPDIKAMEKELDDFLVKEDVAKYGK